MFLHFQAAPRFSFHDGFIQVYGNSQAPTLPYGICTLRRHRDNAGRVHVTQLQWVNTVLFCDIWLPEASISKYDSLAFLLFCGLNSLPTRLHLFMVARTDYCNQKKLSWYTPGQGIFSNDLFQWCSFHPVSNAHSILESPIQFTGLIHLFVFQKHFPNEPKWHKLD